MRLLEDISLTELGRVQEALSYWRKFPRQPLIPRLLQRFTDWRAVANANALPSSSSAIAQTSATGVVGDGDTTSIPYPRQCRLKISRLQKMQHTFATQVTPLPDI
jgi:hypothetical protein